MNIKMAPFKEMLVSIGLSASYQRMRILENLTDRTDHPTVNMLYDDLIAEIPTLSRATVYNTLNALVGKGLVMALTITSEETRYDFKRESHHHFLCKRCGSILDIQVCCKYADVGEVEGHRIEDIHGYFKGTCKGCLGKGRNARTRAKELPRQNTSRKGDKNG
jgi:Fur family transcriptional regulator, peroxide stress response regulator